LNYWRVKAFDGSDSSTYSTVFTFNVSSVSAPRLVSPSNNSMNVSIPVDFDWNDVIGAVSFRLQVSTNIDFSNIIEDINNISSSMLNGITLNYNSMYYWRVKAYTNNDSSGWSSTWNFDTEIGTTEIKIPLSQGWNMISSNVNPDIPLMDSVFNEIKDDVLIVKNGSGKIYVPSFDINTIGDWDLHQGYQVYSLINDSLTILGEQAIPENEFINISIGWNMLSYLRNQPMDASLALTSLVDRDNLLITKNAEGKIYVPSFLINTIGNLISGQGYQMYISGLDTLVYPANGIIKQSLTIPDPTAKILIPLNDRTGSEMTLIVEAELENGTEVGIYDENDILIGSGAFKNGKTGITIWGDDEYTYVKDGAITGEILKAKVLEDGQLIEQELQISNIEGKEPINELTFNKNAIVFANINVQEDLQGVQISPQPVDDMLKLEMPSGKKSIEIRDMKGKLMLELNSDQSIESIDVSNFSNGTYFITINKENKVFTEKFVKMK
jgi:hypothetical protein